MEIYYVIDIIYVRDDSQVIFFCTFAQIDKLVIIGYKSYG